MFAPPVPQELQLPPGLNAHVTAVPILLRSDHQGGRLGKLGGASPKEQKRSNMGSEGRPSKKQRAAQQAAVNAAAGVVLTTSETLLGTGLATGSQSDISLSDQLPSANPEELSDLRSWLDTRVQHIANPSSEMPAFDVDYVPATPEEPGMGSVGVSTRAVHVPPVPIAVQQRAVEVINDLVVQEQARPVPTVEYDKQVDPIAFAFALCLSSLRRSIPNRPDLINDESGFNMQLDDQLAKALKDTEAAWNEDMIEQWPDKPFLSRDPHKQAVLSKQMRQLSAALHKSGKIPDSMHLQKVKEYLLPWLEQINKNGPTGQLTHTLHITVSTHERFNRVSIKAGDATEINRFIELGHAFWLAMYIYFQGNNSEMLRQRMLHVITDRPGDIKDLFDITNITIAPQIGPARGLLHAHIIIESRLDHCLLWYRDSSFPSILVSLTNKILELRGSPKRLKTLAVFWQHRYHITDGSTPSPAAALQSYLAKDRMAPASAVASMVESVHADLADLTSLPGMQDLSMMNDEAKHQSQSHEAPMVIHPVLKDDTEGLLQEGHPDAQSMDPDSKIDPETGLPLSDPADDQTGMKLRHRSKRMNSIEHNFIYHPPFKADPRARNKPQDSFRERSNTIITKIEQFEQIFGSRVFLWIESRISQRKGTQRILWPKEPQDPREWLDPIIKFCRPNLEIPHFYRQPMPPDTKARLYAKQRELANAAFQIGSLGNCDVVLIVCYRTQMGQENIHSWALQEAKFVPSPHSLLYDLVKDMQEHWRRQRTPEA